MQNAIASSSQVTFSAAAEAATSFSEQNNQMVVVCETAKSANIAFIQTQKAIELLAAKREIWENGTYRTATVELYSLLTECYAFYKLMEGNTETAKAKRSALTDYCLLRGFNFKKSTHSINRIIACVFGGVDRRRVSAYATALRKALGHKIETNALVDYFINAGGLEEVRAKQSTTSLTPKVKAEIASQTIAQDLIGTLQSIELAQKLDAANIGEHTVLVGTWNADGSIDIRAVVDNTSILNAALSSYYSTKKAERERAAQEADQQAAEQSKQDAISAAAAESTK